MSAGTNTRELAEALGVSGQAIRKRGSRWAGRQEGGAKVYDLDALPDGVRAAVLRLRAIKARDAAAALGARCSAEISRAWEAYERAAQWQRAKAQERAAILDQVESQIAEGAAVKVAAGSASGAGWRSVLGWRAAVKGKAREHWPALLLPEPRESRKARIHAAAWAWLKADYCRAERPTAEMCIERLRRIAAEQHPEWLPLPSDRRLRDRIKEVDPVFLAFTREGPEAAERLGAPLRRTVDHMQAMEAWNADGHRFDVLISFPDGKVGRPILLAWQDLASRMIVGWRLGAAETADLACLSLADAVREWGLPRTVYLDNGRAFASRALSGGAINRHRWNDPEKDWSGLLSQLGVAVHFVKPYSGKSKPIERGFQGLRDRVTSDERCRGACTGNDPLDKPHNYGSATVPLEVFAGVVREAVADHNQKTGRDAGMCNGRSYAQTFADLYQQASVRMATDAQLRLLLMDSRPLKVSTDGRIRLYGNDYWAAHLAKHIGKRVVVRFDPDNLHAGVHVYEPAGGYILHAPPVRVAGFNDKAAAEARTKELAAQRKALRDAERTMHEQARALKIKPRQILPPEPKPKPGAVVPLAIEKRRRQATAEHRAEPAAVLEHPAIANPKRRAR